MRTFALCSFLLLSTLVYVKAQSDFVFADAAPAHAYAVQTSTSVNSIDYPTTSYNGVEPTAAVEEVALPMSMRSMAVAQMEAQITVKWVTLAGSNSAQFIIERSDDSHEFSPVAFLLGNHDSKAMDYIFTDRDVLPGKSYIYRLKQLDHDGKEHISHPVSAKVKSSSPTMKIYPTHAGADSILKVQLFSGNTIDEFTVTDLMGTKIFTERKELSSNAWNEITIDVHDLPAGNYILKSNEGHTQQFVKK